MIRYIVGIPGAGKTLYAMHRIEQELVATKRWVVTNLVEIKLPEFQAYLNERYPEQGIELSKRLQIIPKVDTREFYRFRGGFTMPALEDFDARWKKDALKTMRPEVRDEILEKYFRDLNTRYPGGCVYFMDEMHRHFRAIEWAEVSYQVLFYATQLRHLNDVWWCMSQNPEQVIVQLKRLAQDCFVLRNHYRESFLLWQKPGAFWWRQYNFVPDTRSAKDEGLQDSGFLKLKVDGIAKCYATRGALGGENLGSETKEKSRKLPFWTIWAGVAVVVMLAGMGLNYFPELSGWAIGKVMKTTQRAALEEVGVGSAVAAPKVNSVDPRSVNGMSAGVVNTWSSPGVNKADAAARVNPGERIVSGVMWAGRRYRVSLSDGSTITESDGTVASIDASGVTLKTGERLRFVPPRVPPPAMPKETVKVVEVPVERPSVPAERAETVVPSTLEPLPGAMRVNGAGSRRIPVKPTQRPFAGKS